MKNFKTIGEFANFAIKQAEAKADRVADALHDQVVQNLSTPGPEPSRPGEPPHKQSGELLKSVRRVRRREFGQQINTIEITDPKATYLEYGTERVAARPFLRPAAELVGAKIDGILDR